MTTLAAWPPACKYFNGHEDSVRSTFQYLVKEAVSWDTFLSKELVVLGRCENHSSGPEIDGALLSN